MRKLSGSSHFCFSCWLSFPLRQLSTSLLLIWGWLKAKIGGAMCTGLTWVQSVWPAWKRLRLENWKKATLSVRHASLLSSLSTTARGKHYRSSFRDLRNHGFPREQLLTSRHFALTALTDEYIGGVVLYWQASVAIPHVVMIFILLYFVVGSLLTWWAILLSEHCSWIRP